MTRNARGFMWFLQQRANKTGQSWWGQDKMAKELGVHVRTIGRWVRELKAENLLDSIRRGSTSNLYTLRKLPVQMSLDVRSDRTKCPNVSIELNFTKEKEQALPARKPPSSEENSYRTAFREEWHRLLEGWTEPAGRRVERQIRLIPNPDIVPVLADCAFSAGLSPTDAILSLNHAVLNAEDRVNRARNPPGLIIHIARSIWKVSA